MKVYTVIAEYMGYHDDYNPNYFMGTYDSLETIVEELGMDMDYILKTWGGVPEYIEWFKKRDPRQHDTGLIYQIIGKDLEYGYFLSIYECELKTKVLEYNFN